MKNERCIHGWTRAKSNTTQCLICYRTRGDANMITRYKFKVRAVIGGNGENGDEAKKRLEEDLTRAFPISQLKIEFVLGKAKELQINCSEF